jgi:hypothetical protein
VPKEIELDMPIRIANTIKPSIFATTSGEKTLAVNK